MSDTTHDPEREVRVRCPDCGNTAIRQRSEAYAELEVFSWRMDGAVPIPSDVDSESHPDWEPMEAGAQFCCHLCNWRGGLDDLKVEEMPDER